MVVFTGSSTAFAKSSGTYGSKVPSPAGTPVGTHSLTYTATVNDQAGEMVRNLVTAAGGGGTSVPSCDACTTEHKVELPLIRLVKTVAVREVRIGDLVRYTLSVENVGARDLVNGAIVDMPWSPAMVSCISPRWAWGLLTPVSYSAVAPPWSVK